MGYSRGRSGGLSPEVALGIKIDATISRNRFQAPYDDMIREIRELGADHPEILAETVGGFIGFYGNTIGHEFYEPVIAALLAADIPGIEPSIEVGRQRALESVHGAR